MSQKTYNKAQCLKLLKVDAKTFDKWLEKANITPVRDDYDTRQKLLTYEQVCLLADQHKRPRPPRPSEDEPEPAEVTPTALYQRIEALEQLIRQSFDALQRELKGVAQQINPLPDTHPAPSPIGSNDAAHPSPTPASTPSTPSTTPPPLTRVTHSKTETKRRKGKPKTRKRLPKEYVALASFSRLHKISEKAVAIAIEKQRLAIQHGDWKDGPRVISRALDRQGQHQFYDLFHGHAKFQPCDHCPHAVS